MTKPFYVEKTGLKTDLNKFKYFLFFILFSDFILPQIPINGFCRLNSFATDSGYSNVFSFNYNNDEYSDLLLFNINDKKALLYAGESGIKFKLKKEIILPLEISKIEPVLSGSNFIDSYAFISRKNKSFGIYKFSSKGKPDLISKIKLDSYPANISIADMNDDSNYVYLVSGNGFDGLSIIKQKNNKLEEIVIDKNRSYQNAVFIDFNSDNYQDVVALNSIENKLHFLFNNTRGTLKELRTIELNEDVLSLKIFDFNYDSFKDIIVSTKSSIIFYFGDASSSYRQFVSIKTSLPADEFVIGDFNRDGYFDINYINKSDGIITTIFSKDFISFYPELIHKKSIGLTEVIPYFSKFLYGTAYINKNGSISILSTVVSMSDEQDLAVGIEPDLISSFDNGNNGIVDFAFTDNYDGRLKFILRNAAGLPEIFYSINLFEDHNNITLFENAKTIKTFFLYSEGKRKIESVEIDFEKFSFKRDHLYAEGSIRDLLVKKNAIDNPEISIAFEKNKKINYQFFTKTTLQYSQSLAMDISSNWLSPIIISAEKPAIAYWYKDDEHLNLDIVNVNNMSKQTIANLEYQNSSIISRSFFDNTNSSVNYVSLICGGGRIYLVKGDKEVSVYSTKSIKNDFRITDKKQLFFGKNNPVFVYDDKQKNIYGLFTSRNGKNLSVKKLISEIDIKNYSIQNFDKRNYSLIFTNNKNGVIGIRQLQK